MKCKVCLKSTAAENVGRTEIAQILRNISGLKRVNCEKDSLPDYYIR
jgi:hypothetical protein